jgi:DNA-binding MarR family transcriptional regulator
MGGLTAKSLDNQNARMSRDELIRQLVLEVRASQAETDAVDQAAAEYMGINRTDLRCLDILDRAGTAITAGALAHEMGLTTGAVTTLVDRLERAGLARRAPDPADRRRVLVEPTPEAGRLGQLLYGGLAEESRPILDRYSDDELALLIGFMRAGREMNRRQAARIRSLPAREGAPRRPEDASARAGTRSMPTDRGRYSS